MKKLLIVTALLGAAVSAMAQGTIQMQNRGGAGVLLAPVYGAESSQLRGNTSAGFPVGSQVYTAALLTGSGFYAELWYGAVGSVEANLSLVPLSLTTFRTGGFAGYVATPAGGASVAIPGFVEGNTVALQLRAWNNAGGTITTWAAAVLADANRGSSAIFTSPPLGGNAAPSVLLGLQSFSLVTTIPEPGTLALAGLGAASLLLFRRKK